MLFFAEKKPPEAEHAEGLAQGSGSLVVRSTDVGPKILQKTDTFSINVFAPKKVHINDLELLSSVPFAEFRRASFPCSQKHLIFMIFGPKALGPWAHGPRPLGPMGPISNTCVYHFLIHL